MFIVWGRKHVYRKQGYVADFCPICREPRAFELKRVGSASHIYYISVGEGQLVGYERTCLTCRTPARAEPSTYASVAKTLPAGLPELQAQTYPNLAAALSERLALEERVRTAPSSLQPEERQALIRSPFVLLSPKVEKRFASTHIDGKAGLTILAAIVLVILGTFVIGVAVPESAMDIAIAVMLALAAALVIWQVRAGGRRFMKREVVPVLAQTLAPLRLTRTEVDAILQELRKAKHKIGGKLRVDDLFAKLETPAQSGS
jgi:hypothetical protein